MAGIAAPQELLGHRLRPVSNADSAALITLIGDIWAEYPGVILDVDGEEPWLREPATAWERWGGEQFVVDGGSLAATVAWRPVDGTNAELKALYVAQQARHGGLGGGLVGLVEDRARAAGAEKMILWTDTRFLDAHRLYERRGYRRTGRTRELNDHSNTTEYEYAKPLAAAPVAERRPVSRTHHGDVFIDDYEWLRDRDDPQVIAHLAAENAYTSAVTADQEQLRESIFNEIKARTQETDLSVPWRRGDWWYYSRMVEGRQYAVHCRLAAHGDDWTPPLIDAEHPPADELVILDENAEAEGHDFFSLGALAISDDQDRLAYGVDLVGNEQFTVKFKDLGTGALLADEIPNAFYGPVWSLDGTALYYLAVDDTWRPYEVRKHVLGAEASTDEVIYREDDATMWISIDRSADHQTLIISSGNSALSEVRLLDFVGAGQPQVVVPRTEGALYGVEPFTLDGTAELLITHDRDGAQNSMVSLVARSELGLPLAQQRWRTVIPHRDDVRIGDAQVACDVGDGGQLIVGLRRNTISTVGFAPIDALRTDGPVTLTEPEFGEELHSCDVLRADLTAPMVRLAYESFITPARVYDYQPRSGELLLRKEVPVRGGYRSQDYVAEREWAQGADGEQIPISIIRRHDVAPGGQHPTVVYGYGSYEISLDPGFSIARLSLLDRGVVYAIAHVRGGGELGRCWYEAGKKQHKMNSFTDFVAVTEHLVDRKWADPARIGAMGGSAGGLLMGAVANLAPQRYAVLLAQVPFVDALTSILDPDLPLSALEWEEWGNPIVDAEAYGWMKAYTPYENVRAAAYPRIAAVTSLDDTRVLYVEPAKWVARLREVSTGTEPIVFKIEMDGGHGGGSGRYKQWEEIAWDYAFVLTGLGIRS